MMDKTSENLKQIWNEVLEDVKKAIGSSDYETWISKLYLIEIDDDTAKISAPTKYIGDNVSWRYADIIVKALNSSGCNISYLNIDVYDNNNVEIIEKSKKKIPNNLPSQEFCLFCGICVSNISIC